MIEYLPERLNWAMRNDPFVCRVLRRDDLPLVERLVVIVNELARERARLLADIVAAKGWLPPPAIVVTAPAPDADAPPPTPQAGRVMLIREGEPLACYSRAHADLHAELLHLCEDRLAGKTDAGWLSRLKRTVDKLHLLTSSEAPWPIPTPPTVPTSTPSTFSPT